MVRQTEDKIGLAAYAIIYLSLFETEPELTEIAHPATFQKAVLDLIDLYPSPATVNTCLTSICAFAAELADESVKEPDIVE